MAKLPTPITRTAASTPIANRFMMPTSVCLVVPVTGIRGRSLAATASARWRRGAIRVPGSARTLHWNCKPAELRESSVGGRSLASVTHRRLCRRFGRAAWERSGQVREIGRRTGPTGSARPRRTSTKWSNQSSRGGRENRRTGHGGKGKPGWAAGEADSHRRLIPTSGSTPVCRSRGREDRVSGPDEIRDALAPRVAPLALPRVAPTWAAAPAAAGSSAAWDQPARGTAWPSLAPWVDRHAPPRPLASAAREPDPAQNSTWPTPPGVSARSCFIRSNSSLVISPRA